MTEQTESKYAKKKNSGKQMYGPGCGAHRLTHVEIHRSKIDIGGRHPVPIGEVPSEKLPIFTDQKTRRA